MSDIQPGDVVVCVDVRLNPIYHKGPDVMPLALGRHYRVASLYVAQPGWADSGQHGLILIGLEAFPSHTRRFRKLNDEPDNAGLIERIRKCKPIKAPVLARSPKEAEHVG